MDFKLKGKRALVTGSTLGIGYAIASRLAAEGAEVVVNGRSQQKSDAAAARIAKETGAKVSGIGADLGSAEGVAALVEQLGPVDILVNNVGIFEPKPFLDIADEDWLHFFQVNVMSGVRLSRALVPHMLKKRWGRIIFISSESALNIPAEMVHYGMTKTAQLAIARGLAESFPASGVTVNSVLPGPTRSDGVVDFLARIARDRGVDPSTAEASFIETHRPTSLIKRFAEPDEVAAPVVYLCSEAASATNGSTVRVDGGVLRSII
jgi:NAD(P)-dependent dehydrogenase (short-subunit alcohol dehydrogenase family)